jgi:hypothetical protein
VRVFLGIVLPLDGEAGLRRRSATASKFLPDFGVALYCGFRFPPGYTPRAGDPRAPRRGQVGASISRYGMG